MDLDNEWEDVCSSPSSSSRSFCFEKAVVPTEWCMFMSYTLFTSRNAMWAHPVITGLAGNGGIQTLRMVYSLAVIAAQQHSLLKADKATCVGFSSIQVGLHHWILENIQNVIVPWTGNRRSNWQVLSMGLTRKENSHRNVVWVSILTGKRGESGVLKSYSIFLSNFPEWTSMFVKFPQHNDCLIAVWCSLFNNNPCKVEKWCEKNV